MPLSTLFPIHHFLKSEAVLTHVFSPSINNHENNNNPGFAWFLIINPALVRMFIIYFFLTSLGSLGDISTIFKNEETGDQR
jgi:hypothetical protein